MMVSCQYSFLCQLQLVSCVIEIQKIGFKKLGMELGEVSFHQIVASNVITRLEPLLNCPCRFKFWGCKYT